MASNDNYEYLNESSIDDLLKCDVCMMPLIDPISTTCQHKLCHQCISRWLKRSPSCPVCRKEPLQEKDLKPITERLIIQMLNQLKVKCKQCGQAGMERGNFNDHIEKTCPKTTIVCPAAEFKCSWKGQREQLNDHLATCIFESIPPAIKEVLIENRQLKQQIQQLQIATQRQQDTDTSTMNTTGRIC